MHAGIRRGPWLAALLAAPLLAAAWAAPASAQLDLNSLQVERSGRVAATAKAVVVQADIVPAADGQGYALKVKAEIAPGYHIYSLTQPAGGPIASRITLDKSDEFKLDGEFKPSVEPQVYPEAAFDNLMVESHEGELAWSAPIQLASGVDPAKLVIKGSLGYQACDASSCLPPSSVKFAATLGSDSAATTSSKSISVESPPQAAPAAGFRDNNSKAELAAHIEPKAVAPGGQATLVVTITPDKEWHAYAWAARDPVEVAKPTLILFSETSGFAVGEPAPSSMPLEKTTGEYVERYHEGPVTWRIALDPPNSLAPGHYPITGMIGYQVCRATGCDQPRAVHFSAELTVDAAEVPGQTPVTFGKPAPYAQAAKLADEQASDDAAASGGAAFDASRIQATAANTGGQSLAWVLVAAFAGGLILNFMPCVLPVIGLKILGFVEQSGDSRASILSLNLWFSAGLIAVFLVLASLAAFLGLRWGEQFTSTAFNVVMSGLVFAMALSFLGVWEIPIPGFVGHGKANDLAAKEGALGAFSKGVLTTVLATPCSGPFLGAVFGFTLRQSPATIYAIFTSIALGMASPYLAIGAFPGLIRFLPRPGAWMDTFKQIMGFVLLGTVVFLMSFINKDYFVPTFAMLIGVWAGCWWIGRTPLTAEFNQKATSWTAGIALAAAVAFMAFTWLVPGEELIAWQPFSRQELVKLTGEGKTVMVDFTADWCLTCKRNEEFALNTEAVSELIRKNGVAPLIADWTDGSPEIKEMLEVLGSASIPVYAIFPADNPNKPIILRDLVSQDEFLAALEAAGPSRTNVAQTASAATKQ